MSVQNETNAPVLSASGGAARDWRETESPARLGFILNAHRNRPRSRAAFTMVELVIVMTIMVVIVSVAAPMLTGFLKGRNLQNEAQRFLALTRYGQSRAISEGIPVDLWTNGKQGRYGLAAVGGFTETKTNEWDYTMDGDVTLSVSPSRGALTTSNFWTPSSVRGSSLLIRFQPDGFISENSPQTVKFRQGTAPEIWIVENANHQRYDIELNHTKSRY